MLLLEEGYMVANASSIGMGSMFFAGNHCRLVSYDLSICTMQSIPIEEVMSDVDEGGR